MKLRITKTIEVDELDREYIASAMRLKRKRATNADIRRFYALVLDTAQRMPHTMMKLSPESRCT